MSKNAINSDDILEILARRVLNTIINEMKQENAGWEREFRA